MTQSFSILRVGSSSFVAMAPLSLPLNLLTYLALSVNLGSQRSQFTGLKTLTSTGLETHTELNRPNQPQLRYLRVGHPEE